MKRGLPILLALLIVGGPRLLAQNEPGKATVLLRHKFSANQTIRYKIVQHITGSRTFPGSNAPTPIEAELRSIIRLKCDQVGADGTASLSIEIESGNLKIGTHEATAFAAGSAPRTLQVTPAGKVIFPPQQAQAGANETRRVLMDFGAIEPLITLCGLPEVPVGVGDAWTSDVTLPSTIAVKVSSTLQGIRSASGEQAATIKQIQTAATDVPNRQDGQSTLVFGIDTGRLLFADGTIHTISGDWNLESKYTVLFLKPS